RHTRSKRDWSSDVCSSDLNAAFESCKALTSFTIPNFVTNIGDNAFQFCVGMTNFTIGAGISRIGNYAFQYCLGLQGITINGTLRSEERRVGKEWRSGLAGV